MTVLKTRLTKIGKSPAIRIPKWILDQLKLGKEVEVEVEQNQLVIRSARHAREGWAAHFQKMRENGDDKLLDAPTTTRFDKEEWEWR